MTNSNSRTKVAIQRAEATLDDALSLGKICSEALSAQKNSGNRARAMVWSGVGARLLATRPDLLDKLDIKPEQKKTFNEYTELSLRSLNGSGDVVALTPAENVITDRASVAFFEIAGKVRTLAEDMVIASATTLHATGGASHAFSQRYNRTPLLKNHLYYDSGMRDLFLKHGKPNVDYRSKDSAYSARDIAIGADENHRAVLLAPNVLPRPN